MEKTDNECFFEMKIGVYKKVPIYARGKELGDIMAYFETPHRRYETYGNGSMKEAFIKCCDMINIFRENRTI